MSEAALNLRVAVVAVKPSLITVVDLSLEVHFQAMSPFLSLSIFLPFPPFFLLFICLFLSSLPFPRYRLLVPANGKVLLSIIDIDSFLFFTQRLTILLKGQLSWLIVSQRESGTSRFCK